MGEGWRHGKVNLCRPGCAVQRRSVPASASLQMAIGRKVVPAWKLSHRRWMSRFIGTGAWEISGGLRPRCELAGCKDRNILEFVRCSRHILWRFCGVWYCDSLQCHEKTKIRSLARHPVFAVLLTSPQGELQRTENPALSVWAPIQNGVRRHHFQY